MAVTHILVPVDLSPRSAAAVRYAAALAAHRRARLTLLYSRERRTAATAEAELARLTELARPVEAARRIVDGDDAAAQIVRFAGEAGVDLVVVAMRPRPGPYDFYLGSVALRVLEGAPVPVVCLREDSRNELPNARILVAVDLTARALPPLEHALALAAELGGALTVVHVAARRAPAEAALRGLLDKLPAAAAARAVVLEAPSAADAVLDLAARERAQLLVIGTRPHLRLSDLLLGSVAMRLIPLAPCPVACVRTEG